MLSFSPMTISILKRLVLTRITLTSMTKPFHGKYHLVYFDNFFNLPKLLQDLQANKTYVCGTI